MTSEEIKSFTIGEYVILRQIVQQGDWAIDDLEHLEFFNWDQYKSLIEKDLLMESQVHKGWVHPTISARTAVAQFRSMLGLNKL